MAIRPGPGLGSGLGSGLGLKLGLDDWRKSLSEQVARRASALKEEFKEDLKILRREPRALAFLLGSRSARLTRPFLGVASSWMEPFTLGMGLSVQKLTEDVAEVGMPGFWRNQGGGGRLHSGALASLGEFTVRLFWDSHLDLKMASTELTRVQVRLLSSPVGVVKSVYRVSIGDREAALFQLRADRAVIVEAQASVYDADARLVAEIEVDLRLTRQEQLASSRQDF